MSGPTGDRMIRVDMTQQTAEIVPFPDAWKLLGGRAHERLSVYANGWYGGANTPEQYVDRAHDVLARGYRDPRLLRSSLQRYATLLRTLAGAQAVSPEPPKQSHRD